MLKSLNRHCLTLLGATFLSAGATYGVVAKDQAQVISRSKSVPGSILKMERIHSANTGLPGIRMVLNTSDKRQMLVHLSAEWVMLSQRLKLTPGDRIIVTGPVIKSGNTAALVAKSIKKGGKRIVLTPKLSE